MVTERIGEVIPPILFGSFANPAFDRIVVDINEVASCLLVSQFRHTSERALEEGPFPVTNTIVLPGEDGRDIPFEGGQVALPFRDDASVDVIRHLTQFQDPDIVLLGKGAKNGKVHQVVADAVKNDFAINGNLIDVVDNTTVKTAISSPHGFLASA
jgi:hypothetical protein